MHSLHRKEMDTLISRIQYKLAEYYWYAKLAKLPFLFYSTKNAGTFFKHTEEPFSSDTRQSMKCLITTERWTEIYSQMRVLVIWWIKRIFGPMIGQFLASIHHCLLEEPKWENELFLFNFEDEFHFLTWTLQVYIWVVWVNIITQKNNNAGLPQYTS